MHQKMRITVEKSLCEGCGECVEGCPVDVFELQEGRAVIVDMTLCGDCRYCEAVCPAGAVQVECVEE